MLIANKYFLIFSFVFFCVHHINSQNRYWIIFSDKTGVEFNPYQYFDINTIERRLKYGIPIVDSTDFPVKQEYIDQIESFVYNIGKQSRWFNAVAADIEPENIDVIQELEFVKQVILIYTSSYLAGTTKQKELTVENTFLLKNQIERMQGEEFIENNITGKNIRIAIFDGGFPSVDVSPYFAHIRDNNRIIKTWDFVRNQENVYKNIAHGTMVLSCIAGLTDSLNIGLATESEFLLARTEMITEPYVEEENWLAAVEWADKNGAHIINSSLGYTYHRYFNTEMDGKTSLVAKAANMAASKGMLVINAMGNDGRNKWKYVGTPADADSVLSVGGINPSTNYHTSFSSLGPTSDKRLKPNVAAFGQVIAVGKKGLTKTQGTSFSSPLVAGFAACAWQLHPEMTNMQIFEEICKSADLYPYYDYAHGYGVPQASYFVSDEIPKQKETFEIMAERDSIFVNIIAEYIFQEGKFVDYLYYNIENNGVLKKYAVVNVKQERVLGFPLSEFKNADILNVHFIGYSESYQLQMLGNQ